MLRQPKARGEEDGGDVGVHRLSAPLPFDASDGAAHGGGRDDRGAEAHKARVAVHHVNKDFGALRQGNELLGSGLEGQAVKKVVEEIQRRGDVKAPLKSVENSKFFALGCETQGGWRGVP